MIKTKIQNPKSKIQNHLVPDLRPGEKIVLLQRRHPMVLFRRLLWPMSLFVIWLVSLFFVLPFISSLTSGTSASMLGGAAIWVPFALWVAWVGLALALTLWSIYLALDWTDSWLALTTHRLIAMDKALFFRETRNELPLGSVQNVIADYPNGFAVTFDFGNLHVDTASVGTITFENLPSPRLMREAIFTQQQALLVNQLTPEDRRKAAVNNILHNQEGNETQNSKPKTQNSQTITWHRHWIYLLRGLTWPCLVWGLVFFLWLASLSDEGDLSSLFGWLVIALISICLPWALYNWEDWRNDLYRIDGERVYDIESLPFGFREQSKETLIGKVTDVSYTMLGPLAHLLDYGDVILKTPGEATEFRFRGIPHPRETQQEIMKRVEEYQQRSKASVEKEIEAWFQAYHDAQTGSL